jgi:hypothetical protein
MLPYHHYLQPQPVELWTVEEIQEWLIRENVKGSAEYVDERRAARVTVDGHATTFRFPCPPSFLGWCLKGQP